MKTATLFLTGRYRREQFPFYRRLCRGRFKIAVDGGISFFRKSGLTPDLLIGDLDSAPRGLKLKPATELIRLPVDKNATDAEQAVDYCLERKFHVIDLVQPSFGEPDHWLGNVLLLTRATGRRASTKAATIRLLNDETEMRFLKNTSIRMSRCIGDTVSVFPISASIRLSCRGFKYPADRLLIHRGETYASRNHVCTTQAEIRIQGEAVVVHTVKSGRTIKINP